MFNILLCEDDRHIRMLMREYLVEAGYNVFESEDGERALEIFDTAHIDLLITDIMMPKVDGVILSKELRDSGYDMPILMITAKSTTEDKRTGFFVGADDYMVKPIDMDEMIIRVSALLRRSKIANDKKIVIGNTKLDYNNFSATVNDNKIEFPKKEFQILFKLLSQPNRIFTRAQLMDEIWGYDTDSSSRTIDVHIRHLREKIEANEDFEILTVKGLGYKAVIL